MLTVAGAPLIMTRMKSQSSAGEMPGEISTRGVSLQTSFKLAPGEMPGETLGQEF